MELKHGLINQNTQEITSKEIGMEKDNITILTDHFIMEISRIIKLMEKEYMNGKMVESMKGNGRIIKCMDRENSLGKMEGNIKVNGTKKN